METGLKSETNGAEGLVPDEIIFGRSAAMRAVRQRVLHVCQTNIPLLLLGESGTGKEVIARYIHARSNWSKGTFVKVNCAAIPSALLESELFGYERGAFTGAQTTKPGLVELAGNGTLFFDEIGELPLGLQAKLLHFLQDGQFTRIGAKEERQVEARIVCSTKKELLPQVEQKLFRSDLYYRINVITVAIPRLSDRREDVVQLADYYRVKFNEKFERTAPEFVAETVRFLQTHEWRGNIRELENWVARYVLLGAEESLAAELAQRQRRAMTPHSKGTTVIPLKWIAKDATHQLERDMILKALQANQWNRRRAAEVLKISYRTLIYKIRNAGIAPRDTRRAASKD
jgi:two-component system response regulator AtoC